MHTEMVWLPLAVKEELPEAQEEEESDTLALLLPVRLTVAQLLPEVDLD